MAAGAISQTRGGCQSTKSYFQNVANEWTISNHVTNTAEQMCPEMFHAAPMTVHENAVS